MRQLTPLCTKIPPTFNTLAECANARWEIVSFWLFGDACGKNSLGSLKFAKLLYVHVLPHGGTAMDNSGVKGALEAVAECKPLRKWLIYEVTLPLATFVGPLLVCFTERSPNTFGHAFGRGELLLFAGLLALFVWAEMDEIGALVNKAGEPPDPKETVPHVILLVAILILCAFSGNIAVMTYNDHQPSISHHDVEQQKALWSYVGIAGGTIAVLLAWAGKVWVIRRLVTAGRGS